MENFICNQHGERFAILNTENIKICGWIKKGRGDQNAFVCFFFNICRKFDVLISQGSVATYLRWDGYFHLGFVANFIRFPAVQKFWKSIKVRQSYRQLKGGNFFETQCSFRDIAGFVSKMPVLHIPPRLSPNICRCSVPLELDRWPV